jgi:hypothetical protein
VATPSGAPARSRTPRGASHPVGPRAGRGARSPQLQAPAHGPRARPGPRDSPRRVRPGQHSNWDRFPGSRHRLDGRTGVRHRRHRALVARHDRRTGPHHRSMVPLPRRRPRSLVPRLPPLPTPGRGCRRTGDLVGDRRMQRIRGGVRRGRSQGPTHQRQVAKARRPPGLARSLRRSWLEEPPIGGGLAVPDAPALLADRQAALAWAGRQPRRRTDPIAPSPARSLRRDRKGSQSRGRDRRTPSRPRSVPGLDALPGRPSSRRPMRSTQATPRRRVTPPAVGPGSAGRAEGLPPAQGWARRWAAPRSTVPRASRCVPQRPDPSRTTRPRPRRRSVPVVTKRAVAVV